MEACDSARTAQPSVASEMRSKRDVKPAPGVSARCLRQQLTPGSSRWCPARSHGSREPDPTRRVSAECQPTLSCTRARRCLQRTGCSRGYDLPPGHACHRRRCGGAPVHQSLSSSTPLSTPSVDGGGRQARRRRTRRNPGPAAVPVRGFHPGPLRAWLRAWCAIRAVRGIPETAVPGRAVVIKELCAELGALRFRKQRLGADPAA